MLWMTEFITSQSDCYVHIHQSKSINLVIKMDTQISKFGPSINLASTTHGLLFKSTPAHTTLTKPSKLTGPKHKDSFIDKCHCIKELIWFFPLTLLNFNNGFFYFAFIVHMKICFWLQILESLVSQLPGMVIAELKTNTVVMADLVLDFVYSKGMISTPRSSLRTEGNIYKFAWLPIYQYVNLAFVSWLVQHKI
jgi:hypothetical protein